MISILDLGGQTQAASSRSFIDSMMDVIIPRVYEYISESSNGAGVSICSTITGLNVVDIFLGRL